METQVCTHETSVNGVPELIQLIPHGSHHTDKGSFTLDEAGLREVMDVFNGRKNQMAIDYEHQSLTGAEAPAAGWIERLVDRGVQGLWAEVRWTERAREYLRGREYRYLSPVFLKEAASGRVMRLLGAGLTNRPAIDGMEPVVNSEGFPPGKNKEVEKMKKLLVALGLDVEATEGQAIEAVNTLKSEAEASVAKDVLDALELEEGSTHSEVLGTVMAFKRGHELAGELKGQVEELSRKLQHSEADDLVAAAMREGKLTPAQEGWAREFAGRDPEGFATFAAKAPSVVPFGQMEAVRSSGAMAETAGLDQMQRIVNSLTGVSDELFRKHNN